MKLKYLTMIVALMIIGFTSYLIYAQENDTDLNQLQIQPEGSIGVPPGIGEGFGPVGMLPPGVRPLDEFEQLPLMETTENMPPEMKKQFEEQNKLIEAKNKRNALRKEIKDVFGVSYDFSKKFFAKSDKKQNFVISPISVYILLSLLSEGATGETKKEIENVIGIQKYDINILHKYYDFLLSSDEYEMADCLYLNKDFPFEKDFISLANKKYKCELKNFSKNPVKDLNDWANEKTHGKIPKIVDSVDPNMVLALLNAVYYKGSWMDEFREHEDGQWTFDNGKKTKINYMVNGGGVGIANNGYVYTLNTKGNTRVLFILPPENQSLSDYISKTDFQEILKPKYEPNTVWTVWLPKFKTDTSIDLTSVLKDMKIQSAFSDITASFDKIHKPMGDDRVYISDAKQKATIKIDEKGVEAAAVTFFGMAAGCCAPIQMQYKTFKFDRPFAYMIVDETNTPLFMGAVYDPTK